jgi:RimJ/RimL family protein N-acetyltransferase
MNQQNVTWAGKVRASLADGSWVEFRLSSPGDFPAILAYQKMLSDKSIYNRFFNLRRPSEEELRQLTHGSTPAGTVFLAIRNQEVIGLARYVNGPKETADVAFTVADVFQGQKLGAVLLQLLAGHAFGAGIPQFTADILGQNHRMRSVFSKANLKASFDPIQGGSASLRLDLVNLGPLWAFIRGPIEGEQSLALDELLIQLRQLRLMPAD